MKVEWVTKEINSGVETFFQVLKNGIVAMMKQNYVPNDKVLKEELLIKAYKSKFAMHPISTKLYKDLKEFY